MTGLRGALATVERKLHDFRLNKMVLSLMWQLGADAPSPRSPVAFIGLKLADIGKFCYICRVSLK